MPRKYSMVKRVVAIEATRGRIEMALIRLLRDKPYGAITMLDISTEADVAARTIHRHYRSKDDVLAACAAALVRTVLKELSERPPPQSSEDTIQDLVGTVCSVMERAGATVWAIYCRAPEVPKVAEAMHREMEARMSLAEALMAQWPDVWAVDRQLAKRMLVAMTGYPCWRTFTDFDLFSTPEAAKLITELLCRSLLRRRGKSGAGESH